MTPGADAQRAGEGEGRLARALRERRERLLAQFVDRSAEMEQFKSVLDGDQWPVMVVIAESGMGKSALLMRMAHECALRRLCKAEIEWTSVDVLDYLAALRKLRDAVAVEHFAAFTDLVNYYTDDNYRPQLDINVQLRGGDISVADGASLSGSQVGTIAGVLLRDNNFTIQRNDIPVPPEARRERLTHHFLLGLKSLSTAEKVVLFFNAAEKMSEPTHQWLWGQLLPQIVDGLPNVRVVLLSQREPPGDIGDLRAFIAHARLKPLELEDIEAYIVMRAGPAAATMDAALRKGLANMVMGLTQGRPAAVADAIDKFLSPQNP